MKRREFGKRVLMRNRTECVIEMWITSRSLVVKLHSSMKAARELRNFRVRGESYSNSMLVLEERVNRG